MPAVVRVVVGIALRHYPMADLEQRFLMVQPSEQRSPTTDFNVVLNWFEELKQRVPVK